MKFFTITYQFLLHGAGFNYWDEILIFGGVGIVIIGLLLLSWREGRKKDNPDNPKRKRR